MGTFAKNAIKILDLVNQSLEVLGAHTMTQAASLLQPVRIRCTISAAAS